MSQVTVREIVEIDGQIYLRLSNKVELPFYNREHLDAWIAEHSEISIFRGVAESLRTVVTEDVKDVAQLDAVTKGVGFDYVKREVVDLKVAPIDVKSADVQPVKGVVKNG